MIVIDPQKAFAIASKALATMLQKHMEEHAQADGYDNLLSACSYAAQPVGSPFQAKGAAYVAWRSAVWMKSFEIEEQVKTGQRPMPTEAEALALMPPFVTPND